jgi:hypothetical protein
MDSDQECSECSEGMTVMIDFERNKERQRFYLLPGMGGEASRQKHRWMLQWGVVAGLVVSAALAVLLYLAHQLPF